MNKDKDVMYHLVYHLPRVLSIMIIQLIS